MANNNKKAWHEEITNYIRRYYGVCFELTTIVLA